MKLPFTSIILMSVVFCGCQSGLYKISTSEDDKKIDGSVRYYDVAQFDDCFIKDNGASPDGILYDENNIPVRITEGQSNRKPDKSGWSGVLWMFSLGLFPMCESEYMTQHIWVESPICQKSGSYRIEAKRWHGWIPLFIGYPGLADDRDANAKLPNLRVERIARERLVKNLVGQFSFSDYVAFAKTKNNERKAEIARIRAISGKVDNLLSKNQFSDVLKLIADESKSRVATQKCDDKSWADMRERVTIARQTFDKKHIQNLIASGKYENAILYCDSKNSLASEINDELKKKAIKTAVKELNDITRLITFLKLIKEGCVRDEVVRKLKSLNSLSKLATEQLAEIANTSKCDDVIIAVIKEINDKIILTSLLNKKQSENVFKALIEKIADADAIRTKIWQDGNEEEKCIYVSVYGSDEECQKIIQAYPNLLTDNIINALKSKITREEIRNIIDELQISRVAHEITELEGTNLIQRVLRIQDRDVRQRVALRIINEMRNNSKETISTYPKIDIKEFSGLITSEQIREKIRKIRSQQRAENRYRIRSAWSCSDYRDAIECLYSYGEERERKYRLLCDSEREIFVYLSLLRIISKDDLEAIVASIKSIAAERIHFEGFYIGMSVADYIILSMSVADYIILSRYSKCEPPKIDGYKSVDRIEFNHTIRFKLFDKEDGEFWSAFMRKYIPARKKKSLGEAIGDALDSGTYDYQTGYDDDLEEHCYIYKSMKYGTKVIFGQKTGTLVLKEYK